MWKALARKEFREIAGIAALAFLAYAGLVSAIIGMKLFEWLRLFGINIGAESVPFVDSTFAFFFCTISLLFAAALGFRQSAWEWARHTYLFLLHRPLERSQIWLIKIAAGLAVLLAVSAGAILAVAIWAATPLTHPAPFYWSMTEDSWCYWLGCSAVYLGSFLSGLRAARWFGTRLLPLAASLLLLFLTMAFTGANLMIMTPIILLLDLLLAIAICHVATIQDFS